MHGQALSFVSWRVHFYKASQSQSKTLLLSNFVSHSGSNILFYADILKIKNMPLYRMMCFEQVNGDTRLRFFPRTSDISLRMQTLNLLGAYFVGVILQKN